MVAESTVLGNFSIYILKDSSVKVNKNKLPHICLKLVDRCITGYTNTLKYSERLNMVMQAKEIAAVLGDIECNKAAYMDSQKARFQNDEEVKSGKYSYKKIHVERYLQKGLDLCTIIMEVLWEREVGHISSIKIPQFKNNLCYHY